MSAVERAGRSWVRQADEDVGKAAIDYSGTDLETEGVGRGVQLTEWEKDGWTYHAKGGYHSINENVSCSDHSFHFPFAAGYLLLSDQ